jgi:hypothetical protein
MAALTTSRSSWLTTKLVNLKTTLPHAAPSPVAAEYFDAYAETTSRGDLPVQRRHVMNVYRYTDRAVTHDHLALLRRKNLHLWWFRRADRPASILR